MRWLSKTLHWAAEHPCRAVGVASGAAAVGIPIGALLFAWSGAYSVAASRGHWHVVELFLRFGMENSVRVRAPDHPPADLDDPDMIRLGAAHFHGGCAFCHGAPGTRPNPVVQAMLPSPPDLQDQARVWSDGELFWIVRNGLKYAGMPAWPAQSRDDEVWAVVAFTRKLPQLDAAAYERLALGVADVRPGDARELATSESDPDGVGACARCHGAEGSGPASTLVPLLHGQPREWLLRSLRDYATGARQSGIMQPLAAALTDDAAQKLAAYYARLAPPASPAPVAGEPDIEAGARLASEGVPQAAIPACLNCHGPDRSPQFPRLAGLSARYIATQLHAWKNGKEGASATHAIMAPIARRLDDRQIAQAAAFFASQPAGGGAAP